MEAGSGVQLTDWNPRADLRSQIPLEPIMLLYPCHQGKKNGCGDGQSICRRVPDV